MKKCTVSVEVERYTRPEIGKFDTEEGCWKAIENAADQYPDCDFIISEEDGYARRIAAHQLRKESCPVCGKMTMHMDMERTYDCHGIPFRRVCHKCYMHIMETKGYDGEYYTEADECIDSDY